VLPAVSDVGRGKVLPQWLTWHGNTAHNVPLYPGLKSHGIFSQI
jgi:hypothetical protein